MYAYIYRSFPHTMVLTAAECYVGSQNVDSLLPNHTASATTLRLICYWMFHMLCYHVRHRTRLITEVSPHIVLLLLSLCDFSKHDIENKNKITAGNMGRNNTKQNALNIQQTFVYYCLVLVHYQFLVNFGQPV